MREKDIERATPKFFFLGKGREIACGTHTLLVLFGYNVIVNIFKGIDDHVCFGDSQVLKC